MKHEELLKGINDQMNHVRSQLNKAMIDMKKHLGSQYEEFKKDLETYSKLISENRHSEAATFQKKMIEKYDKQKENGV